MLKDLELCGFIQEYTPFNLRSNSLLARYHISDQYLQFYFKFIHPIQSQIENSDFNREPTRAIHNDSYIKWLGYSFERMCRKKHKLIARILGFEAVEYTYGAYFSRYTQKNNPEFQIDLVFQRKDKVLTVCEIKYLQSPVTANIINEFEKKLDLFPWREKNTIQKVLISGAGATKDLISRSYFDRIITLNDLF